MARQKSEKTKRREKLLEAFEQLDSVKQSYAQRYLDDLLDLQYLEKMLERTDGYRERGEIFCSYCGKPQEEVNRLIASHDNTYICDDCVRMCMTIVDPDYQLPEGIEKK